MAHASPVPCSSGTDDVPTISLNTPTNQAATRAAYIESILADWPAPSSRQQRTIGALLGNATPTISVADYQSWEIRRHIDSETPGKFGTFSANDVAA